MESHVFIVAFGEKYSRKAVGLRKGEDCIAEFFVADITDENGKALKYGDDVPEGTDTNLFLVFRFMERKDWDNFVNIINHQDYKLKEYYMEHDSESEKKEN